MKKIIIALGLLITFVFANTHKSYSDPRLYYYPLILSCGITIDYYSPIILTDEQLLEILDQYEATNCGSGETPVNPIIQ